MVRPRMTFRLLLLRPGAFHGPVSNSGRNKRLPRGTEGLEPQRLHSATLVPSHGLWPPYPKPLSVKRRSPSYDR